MNKGQFLPKWKYPSKDPKVRKTYKAWNNAMSRCNNPKDDGYPNYGGRGITVCERWRNSFDFFVEDMGLAPKGMTLERIDFNGHYDPFNCKWATRKEQANNMRSNVLMTLNGKTMTATQWAEALGISTTRLHARLRLGWEPEQAINPAKYEAPHGGSRRYVTGCRCDICVAGEKARRYDYYRKKNPVIKNKSRNNPEKQYDL